MNKHLRLENEEQYPCLTILSYDLLVTSDFLDFLAGVRNVKGAITWNFQYRGKKARHWTSPSLQLLMQMCSLLDIERWRLPFVLGKLITDSMDVTSVRNKNLAVREMHLTSGTPRDDLYGIVSCLCAASGLAYSTPLQDPVGLRKCRTFGGHRFGVQAQASQRGEGGHGKHRQSS